MTKGFDMSGPAQRTRAQWRKAFRAVRREEKIEAARRDGKVKTVLCFPGDPDLELTPPRARRRKERGIPPGTPVMRVVEGKS